MGAPLGFKTFATGDVLTAADTNGYLMQGVWTFASAAARDAAVTSPQEGNMCYLKDTDAVQYYSGSAWTPVSTSGSLTNLLLNSNFALNQRAYVSAANLASGTYGFDRWKSNYTNTTLTFTASTQGQSVTINASGGLQQVIEQGLVPSGTYTLSWTGTATGRVYNFGGTPPSYAASPVTFTADGTANVVVEFTAVSTTKTLSKVQFNAGSNTTWSLATPTLATELLACQRYYWQSEASSQYFWSGNTTNASSYNQYCKLPTTMRVAPTITLTGQDNSSFPATAGSAIRINTNSFLEQRVANATASGAYFGSSVIATSEL
ncbi:hypothetical protein UFOVP1262_9 [uncultured Caudovirales phage]|uniref:Uncharacterized protein n=1 Tax=uncultured Caudovirales phage TaxID=2100421 RepID=A0A6J5PDM0_9CAUD|nr:hypothetical protein UFOVP863_10 [uncultured Caudovirales phage]CAB4180261.1 hypothetical protein UFOVP1042_14 [uncultured Caudovirales phage]CAB4194121.1 hypothetical protein UFOVP1262_9 [uncultured Caudovirales phage]